MTDVTVAVPEALGELLSPIQVGTYMTSYVNSQRLYRSVILVPGVLASRRAFPAYLGTGDRNCPSSPSAWRA